MSRAQTDNSYLGDKIALRLSMLPRKKCLNVLDAFHGNGTIWKNIQKRYSSDIQIVKIDIEQKDDLFTLIGNNKKYLSALPIEKYDVIDLDSYGVPYEQLKIVFERAFKGLIFVTFIQSVMGRLQNSFLNDLGYTETMIKKCPSLFCKDGYKKLLHWLAMKGIKKIMVRQHSRKSYLAFVIE